LAAFVAAGFLAISFLFPAVLVALVAAFFTCFGADFAGEVVAAGVEATTAGVVVAGIDTATFGFLWALLATLPAVAALGLLFEAGVFDADLFCALAISYYYK